MVGKLSFEELITFNTELKSIIKSNVPIDVGLKSLLYQLEGRLRQFAESLSTHISSGYSLSDALAQHRDLLEDYYISLIKAAEMSGNLETVLNTLIRDYRKSLTVHHTIIAAVRYPVILVTLFLAVLFVVSKYAVPNFKYIYYNLQAALPPPTEFVIKISDFFTGNIVYIVVSIILLSIGYYRMKSTPRGKDFMDSFKFRAPILRRLMYYDVIISFARALSTLLLYNIPLDVSLMLSRGCTPYSFSKKLIDAVIEEVKKGKRISEALSETNLLPSHALWMLQLSEERGDLPEVLNNIADYYERRYYNFRDNIISYIEPALMVLLGLIIGGFVTGLYKPLFDIPKMIK